MPELPEVETIRRGLQQLSCGITIAEVQVLLPRTIDHPDSAVDFASSLQGLVIQEWQRRGKYLLGVCANQKGQVQGWLGVHLRMTGQLLWLTDITEPPKHTRVRILMANQQELRFVDQRTFGKMWWITTKEDPNQVMGGLGKLGPEPFSPEFSNEYFVDRLHRSRRQIKAAILDQTLVAGVGNIYADESLFLSKIMPTAVTTELQPQQIHTLRQTIIQVLQDSIAAGGTTFSNYLSVTGTNGNYANQAWVYGRQGGACRTCGELIIKTKVAGRGTHHCPVCQS